MKTLPLLFTLFFLAAVPAWARTIHVFTVFCNAYQGDAGGINAGVSADRVIVNHIFSEYVSPAAWGVEVRQVEVAGERATKAGIEE